MIKAIIFDCFGVVVGQGFEYTYLLAGGDPKQDRPFMDELLYRANSGHISNKEFDELICNHLNISSDAWQKAVIESEKPNRELLNYVKDLRTKYKTAILSNANKGTLDNRFGDRKLSDYFDDIIVSAEIGLVKPDPQIFDFTAKRLNLSTEECLFIDDHILNVEAAKQAGMKSIRFSSSENKLDDLKQGISKILSE